ncbi:MAG TPA: hypothetical protein VGP64_16975 [Polyangia bacterium]
MASRLAALATVSTAVMVSGCWGRGLPPIDPEPGSGSGGIVGTGGASNPGTGGTVTMGPPTPSGKLDVLFMVDNSASMAPLQTKMAAQLSTFMNGLKNATTGTLPDLHVAVVSSSFGAGEWGNVNQCYAGSHPGDDQGKFQQGPGGAGSGSCAMLHTGEKFLKTRDDAGTNAPNFEGDLVTAFQCMALIGDNGCGFESQFESIFFALHKGSLPLGSGVDEDPDNGGFLRADAQLAVVMLTNEDDCSVASNSLLLDPSINSVNDPSGLGALHSYRCNEFGHLCNGAPPPHGGPTALPAEGVTLTNCVSAEELGKTDLGVTNPTDGTADATMGHLFPTVGQLTGFLRTLKANPSDIFVAAIAGPTVDANGASLYKVVPVANPAANGELDPMVAHSCTQATSGGYSEYADPAVRIKQWVDNFGPNGVFYPICADSFQGTMGGIAAAMRGQLGF